MVRKFQKSDLELVMEIWLSGNEDAHPFISKEYWKSNFESVQEQLLEAEVYVFEADEVIKGFIGMQGNYIAGIFVKREFRRAGIGRQLLNYVKAGHSDLTLHVYQKNKAVVEFYRREGFCIISEEIESDTKEVTETMSWRQA